MQGFLIAIHTIISLILITVILMQASKGGGLSGTFGSATTSAIFGGRGAATLLSKLTTWLAIGFMVLAMLISLISAPRQSQESLLRQEAQTRPVAPGADLSLPTGQLPEEGSTGE